MPAFTPTDWYRFPRYYDIVFDGDTPREADFLEAALERHGPAGRTGPTRILEPACGSGRTVIELARRGHDVVGFDASSEMLDYARDRARAEACEVRRRLSFRKARMESFNLPGPFDFAHCLLSTFKYLLTEEHAFAHLQRVARVLAPGGIYVLGLHLTDYTRRRSDREVWRGERDGVHVVSEVVTRPPDRTTRLEWLRNRLSVRRRSVRGTERLETNWQCRTYDAGELSSLLARVPHFEPVACYDFTHDVDAPRALDDAQEDLVVVLQKRAAPSAKVSSIG
jgi:SAM-dependent methyltransferase